MERVKQKILALVDNHFSDKNFNHEYVQSFRHFEQFLNDSTLELSQDSAKRFEKVICERTAVMTEVACDKRFVEETYEVLCTILKYLRTDEVCYYFHDLVGYYWKALDSKYRKAHLELVDEFPAETYENLVKVIWLYVKIDYVVTKLSADNENKILVKELLGTMDEYLQKPSLLREDCYKIVENHVGSKNFKLRNYNISFLEERLGYLGDYFKIQITYSQSEQDQVLHLFAKCLPSTLFVKIALSAFSKEDFFYGEFMSKLKELGFQGIDDFMPKCYFSRKNDVIVMEDVSLQGYSVLKDHFQENELAGFVVSVLARMHSASLMFEEKMSIKLGTPYTVDSDYYQFVQETAFSITNSSGAWIRTAAHEIHEYILDKFPEVPKKISMRMFKIRSEYLLRQMFFHVQKSKKFRNAISHGDLWYSNYLFSRGEGGKLKSCLLIDFQLMRYAPPVLDLLFFIFMNLSKHTRELHTDSLVNDYYKHLTATFEDYNLDINKVYTRERLWESFDYYRPTGICMALCYAQMLSMPDEVLDEIRADEDKMKYFQCVERSAVLDRALKYPEFRAKIKGLVEDLYECCVAMDYP